MRPYVRRAMQHLAPTPSDDIRIAAMLTALVLGIVGLMARLSRLSRDVDTHARQHDQLWAETADIRTKMLSIGEDLAQSLSSPASGGSRP